MSQGCLVSAVAGDSRVFCPAGEDLLEQMGRSPTVRKIVHQIEQVADTDFSVVIWGETGAGKELVARAIHRCSRRARGPFIAFDCAAIPETLLESELFGHERGAFTGAERARAGKFELASGGSLLLDEIANLPLSVQVKLLRAFQEREVWRVGATAPRPIDFRLLTASNTDLAQLVERDRFRPDLFHRVNEFTIYVAALRDRPEDIPLLVERFVCLTNQELGKQVQGLREEAWRMVLSYRWPGNGRELRNCIRRAVLLATDHIGPEHLRGLKDPSDRLDGPHTAPDPDGDIALKLEMRHSLKEIVHSAVEKVERAALARMLQQTNGNKAMAARLLKVDYKTIHNKLRQYHLS